MKEDEQVTQDELKRQHAFVWAAEPSRSPLTSLLSPASSNDLAQIRTNFAFLLYKVSLYSSRKYFFFRIGMRFEFYWANNCSTQILNRYITQSGTNRSEDYVLL